MNVLDFLYFLTNCLVFLLVLIIYFKNSISIGCSEQVALQIIKWQKIYLFIACISIIFSFFNMNKTVLLNDWIYKIISIFSICMLSVLFYYTNKCKQFRNTPLIIASFSVACINVLVTFLPDLFLRKKNVESAVNSDSSVTNNTYQGKKMHFTNYKMNPYKLSSPT